MQLAREFNSDYFSKGVLGGDQQDPALARSEIYKSELCCVDVEFIELIAHELNAAWLVPDGVKGDGRINYIEASNVTGPARIGAVFLIEGFDQRLPIDPVNKTSTMIHSIVGHQRKQADRPVPAPRVSQLARPIRHQESGSSERRAEHAGERR
jgi:hypothetical protein